eukprot:7453042-Alexandrium_andersonii.AAC.1
MAAIEWFKQSQDELSLRPERPGCMFGDILDFPAEPLQSVVRDALKRMQPLDYTSLAGAARGGGAARRCA